MECSMTCEAFPSAASSCCTNAPITPQARYRVTLRFVRSRSLQFHFESLFRALCHVLLSILYCGRAGVDPSHEQWDQIAAVMKERCLLPWFDNACKWAPVSKIRGNTHSHTHYVAGSFVDADFCKVLQHSLLFRSAMVHVLYPISMSRYLMTTSLLTAHTHTHTLTHAHSRTHARTLTHARRPRVRERKPRGGRVGPPAVRGARL